MTVVTREECEWLVTELTQLDAGARLARVFELAQRAARDNAWQMLILVGLILRDREQFALADPVFRSAEGLPDGRHSALFELAVSLGLQGRPEEAVTALRQCEGVGPLNPFQQRLFAVQLARVGFPVEAAQRLDDALAREPGCERFNVALRQYFSFAQRFPADQMIARCLALRDSFSPQGPAEVISAVREALAAGAPYSMIRLNDGEGSVIRVSDADEDEYDQLYALSRADFLPTWFGDEGDIQSPAIRRAVEEFNACVANADCVAADVSEHLRVRFRQGDFRNMVRLSNIVRKLELVRDAGGAQGMTLSDPILHQLFLADGVLEALLEEQDRVGLVSWNPALPDALARRFGLKEVYFHRTSGERAVAATDPEPFARWHSRVVEEVSRARPGVLYLVAAGFMSKIYCDRIKRAGGVALDIGSVVDIWMKVPTRVFGEVLRDRALESTEPG